ATGSEQTIWVYWRILTLMVRQGRTLRFIMAIASTKSPRSNDKVAWMKRSGIRDDWCTALPDSVALHPGYGLPYSF
ncbi:MAG: hypothetical protein ABW115_09350, partial [Candidatus Thiodiazotropha sp. 6PLUC6]